MNSPFIPDPVITPAAVMDTDVASVFDTHAPSPAPVAANDPVPGAMPSVMRIESIERSLTENGLIRNRAVLFHERCSITVDWLARQADTRLHRHGLAVIRHAQTARSSDGALRIDRLLPAERVLPQVNLFLTVPHGWVKDRELVARGAALWEELPRPLAHLFNAVFWKDQRFHRFAMGPSSLRHHHSDWNGNLRHSIDVAERARDIGRAVPLVNSALLIAAGLLHDAAKADEYRWDRGLHAFRLSDRGELIGHRDTLIEWLAVARRDGQVVIPEAQYLELLHTINATSGAPAWLGLREPRCLEAEILSMADRLSGREDIHVRHAPRDGCAGFGRRQPNGQRGYVTRREPA